MEEHAKQMALDAERKAQEAAELEKQVHSFDSDHCTYHIQKPY